MLKISSNQKKLAQEIGRKHKVSVIYVNDKNEFFSDEQLCKASVAGNKENYVKVEIFGLSEKEKEEQSNIGIESAEISNTEDKDQSGNDTLQQNGNSNNNEIELKN